MSYNSELYRLSFDSIEENEDEAWPSLIRNLSFDQLLTLKQTFNTNNDQQTLNQDEFLKAIEKLFQNSKFSLQAVILFEEITQKSKSVEITWSDFINFLMKHWHLEPQQIVTLSLKSISPITVIKRECIIKIILIESEQYFCYALLAKYGRVGLFDGNLNFLTTYQLVMTQEDLNRREEERRRRNRWVTDAVFCKNILMMIVTMTTRSLIVYDVSGLGHVPVFLILSLPNIVQCLTYVDDKDTMLFMGDDKGEMSSLTFLRPKTDLFRKKHTDKITIYFWQRALKMQAKHRGFQEVLNETDNIVFKNYGKLQDDSINQLEYFQDNGTLFSCSHDPNLSLLVKYLCTKNKCYNFKMDRGCSCFASSRILKILITGSDDGILRLWNPVITLKPIAVLSEHKAGIVDVKIMENQKTLKLWNISDYNCLQTLKLRFPSFNIYGRLIEWGRNCIYPGPKRALRPERDVDAPILGPNHWERSHILVACCNYVACINLSFNSMKIEESLEMPILQTFPLQNSVVIPKFWKLSSSNEPTSEAADNGDLIVDDSKIQERLEDLKFILEKDFIAESNSSENINYKIATLEEKKQKIQKHMSEGAPYLGLELCEIEELALSPNLPVPDKKKTRKIVVNTRQSLEAASARDLIFSSSQSSSKSPFSSRSSVVEFPY